MFYLINIIEINFNISNNINKEKINKISVRFGFYLKYSTDLTYFC